MHTQESKFLQFHTVFGKILQNHKLAPPPESWCPHLREILDPPLLSPGYPAPWIPYLPRYPTLQKGHETRDTLPCPPPEGTWDRRYPNPLPPPREQIDRRL